MLCAGLEAQLASAGLCVCPGPQRPEGDSHPDVAASVHPPVEPDAALPHDQVRSESTLNQPQVPNCAESLGLSYEEGSKHSILGNDHVLS